MVDLNYTRASELSQVYNSILHLFLFENYSTLPNRGVFIPSKIQIVSFEWDIMLRLGFGSIFF